VRAASHSQVATTRIVGTHQLSETGWWHIDPPPYPLFYFYVGKIAYSSSNHYKIPNSVTNKNIFPIRSIFYQTLPNLP
jgi:hypothetical protein